MVCPDTAPLQNLAVSPGLTLRPSLSVERGAVMAVKIRVSPGLTLRPSLSDAAGPAGQTCDPWCRRG